MKCSNCGAEIRTGAAFCQNCGCKAEPEHSNDQNCGQNYGQQYVNAPSLRPSAISLATGRGLVKMIFLSLITFGIYGTVIWSRIADEINITASRYDGRKTMPYFAMLFVSPVTLFILPFVWNHNLASRIGNEARRRGYNTHFGAADFWLWNVLGSLIIVGPFVYIHRLCKNMNMVNENYNLAG